MAKSGPGEIEVYRSNDGAELAVIAATWHLNPKVTFSSLSLEFEKNEPKAWRNYGSRIKGAGDLNALKDPDLVNRLANRNRSHPWDEARGDFVSSFRGVPGLNYFIHIDLAKNHCACGVAMVHLERPSGRVVVDFMDGVVGQNGRDIQISDVREKYVYALTARGFHIQGVSYDQWNSLESQQQLLKRGYQVDEVSADKTTGPYDTLFDLLLTGRLDYYLHPQFIREAQKLYKLDRKYDHPKGGSKDVTDAVACAASQAIASEIDSPWVGDSRIIVHRKAPPRVRIYD